MTLTDDAHEVQTAILQMNTLAMSCAEVLRTETDDRDKAYDALACLRYLGATYLSREIDLSRGSFYFALFSFFFVNRPSNRWGWLFFFSLIGDDQDGRNGVDVSGVPSGYHPHGRLRW